MAVAITIIMVAFVLYTISVFAERSRGLTKVIVLIFAFGFVFDLIGTCIMSGYCRDVKTLAESAHGLIGQAALVIMGLHALTAIVVLFSNSMLLGCLFRRCSIWAWALWLVTMCLGGLCSSLR